MVETRRSSGWRDPTRLAVVTLTGATRPRRCGTGFIARLGGTPSYDIIQFALTALERLTHRGGVDADGAAAMAPVCSLRSTAFFRARAQEQGIELPEMFGVGFAFLPSSVVEEARAAVEVAADTERLRVIGWRRVPVNTNCLGRRALETMPEIWQFFVEPFHPTREPSDSSGVWLC